MKGTATTTTTHTPTARRVADSSYASRWAQETYPALLDELYPKDVPTADGKGLKRADGYLFKFTTECKKKFPEAYAKFLDGTDGLLAKIKAEKGETPVSSSASSVVSSASSVTSATSSSSTGTEKAKVTNLKKLLTKYGVAYEESSTLAELEGLRDAYREVEKETKAGASAAKKAAEKAERESKAAEEKRVKAEAAAAKKAEQVKAKAEKEMAEVVEWLDARNIVRTGLNLEQMLALKKANASKRAVKAADRKIPPKATITVPVPSSLTSSSSTTATATAAAKETTYESIVYEDEIYEVDKKGNAYLTDEDGTRVFAGIMETVEGEEGEEPFLNTEADEIE